MWVLLVLVLGAVARAADPAPDPEQRLSGRGVYYVAGHIRCPLAGVGSRAADASNRVALDDDHTEVTVDRAAHRITFRNTHRYPRRQLIGDLVLLGTGTTKKEGTVPFAVHLKIEKDETRFRTAVHPHPTTRAQVIDADVEPFEVFVTDGHTATRVLDPATARKAIREPELTARVANLFLQVEDHTEGKPIQVGEGGGPLVDLTIGYGAPHMNLRVARVQVLSLEPSNAALIRRGALAEMLAHGAWELRIAPGVVPLPKEEFERDLFLFGVDDVAVLAPLKTHGLAKGETLVVGYRDGKGFIGIDERRAEISNPSDVARSYLEFHFLGGVIARQIATLPQRVAQASWKE